MIDEIKEELEFFVSGFHEVIPPKALKFLDT